MRERAALVFPLVLAAALPLAGLLLAAVRLAADKRGEALAVLAATLLGGAVWGVLLASA